MEFLGGRSHALGVAEKQVAAATDGGAQAHDITAGAANTTYTATYNGPPPTATPLTAAITGLGMSRIIRCSRSISNMPHSVGP